MSRSSGYARVVNDWYREPRWAVDALLDVEPLTGASWDPACGSGTIPMALRARGLSCRGSDIADRGFGETGVDFFSASGTADNIVSNPPYGMIERFLRRASDQTTGKVCLLARLAFLESAGRQVLFRELPPARVWVSRHRISMPPGGTDIKAKGGTVAYAWFVWDHHHGASSPPVLGWF